MTTYTNEDARLAAGILYNLDRPNGTDWYALARPEEVEARVARIRAHALLGALADAGRLLPVETERSDEWGIWWHAGDSDGICLSLYQLPTRDRAERRAAERVGEYGITRYTLVRRTHRGYADGSHWTGPWEAAPAPAPDYGLPNDIDATGHCCCNGCVGEGLCDLDPRPDLSELDEDFGDVEVDRG